MFTHLTQSSFLDIFDTSKYAFPCCCGRRNRSPDRNSGTNKWSVAYQNRNLGAFQSGTRHRTQRVFAWLDIVSAGPAAWCILRYPQRLALAFLAVCLLLAYAGLVWIGIQKGLPWYSFLGGIIGILVVLGTVFSINKLGVANAITLLLASQVLAAALLQQFGLLGQEASPLSAAKLVGLGILLMGAVIAVRS